MNPPVHAYVGVGSNLDGPREQVVKAIADLDLVPATRVLAASGLYRNPPLGPADQPDYVNAVVQLETGLAADALLERLQRLEDDSGRVRCRRWDARTLDLDILVYGERVSDDPDLTLPHPGLAHRAFVLVPLAEIAPDLAIPGKGLVTDLRDALPAASREALVPIE